VCSEPIKKSTKKHEEITTKKHKRLDNKSNVHHNEKAMKKNILEKIKTCLIEREEILFAYILGTF
jgi:hypothetical protein